jgi:tripartite-type tricarboxylate transporter receptor subunit TctC
MQPTQRHRRAFVQTLAALSASPWLARAEDGRPVEWVVGYPAGGGSDIVARTLAEPMGKALGRTLLINNKPGASTNIAADYVAKSKDYGHIMLTADLATLAANPALFTKLPYNAEKDFIPVGLMARFPMLLVVNPSVPARNYPAFVAWAKAQPGGINYASAGTGSPHHLAGELLRERSGLAMTHVPYRGAAPAVQDLMGGQVPCAMMDTAAVMQPIASGKLRALGVASPARLKIFPEVATLAEQGLTGFEAYAWQGLVVPTGTPPETVAALSKALQSALDTTFVKARFQTLGLEALPGTPEQMAGYARSERERWGALIRKNNIKLD